MRALTISFALLLFACGSSTPPASSTGNTTEQDGAQPETCAGHRLGDVCINEENFARCLELEAQCPGQVLQLESCPLQFACP